MLRELRGFLREFGEFDCLIGGDSSLLQQSIVFVRNLWVGCRFSVWLFWLF
jgi:hypothetical protein